MGDPKDDRLLNRDQALYFRDELRSARASALADSEDFDNVIHAVERIGSMLAGRIGTLDTYRDCLCELAKRSPLAVSGDSSLLAQFSSLYWAMLTGRNDALHQGAVARHMTTTCVSVALVLEDALMSEARLVRDFMVKAPVCAELWQPLGFIRQAMLCNSFSYLPVKESRKGWSLVDDFGLARYLRDVVGKNDKERWKERNRRIQMALGDAVECEGVVLIAAKKLDPRTTVSDAFEDLIDRPALVVHNGDLVGILTAFDLL